MNNKLETMQVKLGEIVDKRTQQERHKQNLQSMASLEKTVRSSISGLGTYLGDKTLKTEVVNQLKSISTPDVDKVVKAIEKLDKALANKDVDLSPLVKGLSAVEQQLKLIPKEHADAPEAVESVSVSNLSEIDLKPLEKAIKGLKINPEVHVKPEVNVEAPNLSPIKDALADVIDAIKQIPLAPETDLSKVEKKLDKSNELLKEIVEKPMGGGGGGGNGTPYVDDTGRAVHVELVGGAVPITGSITASASTLADYSVNDIEEDTTSYFGYTKPDGTWLVKSLTDTSVSYATETNNGAVTSYTDAWTNRVTLTYQRFDQAF
jgi:hypothetical protein